MNNTEIVINAIDQMQYQSAGLDQDFTARNCTIANILTIVKIMNFENMVNHLSFLFFRNSILLILSVPDFHQSLKVLNFHLLYE